MLRRWRPCNRPARNLTITKSSVFEFELISDPVSLGNAYGNVAGTRIQLWPPAFRIALRACSYISFSVFSIG